MRPDSHTGKFNCYVPRGLLRRLAVSPHDAVQTPDGTVVFVDVSGFTRLSERLARTGKEGAEQLTDAINACFSALLAEAHAGGGSLLKFGGDAMLLWFEGDEHAARACASAAAMRSTLRRVGRLSTGAGKVVLRMSAGVHSGEFHMFLVGASHREYVIAGPASSRVVANEAAASAGQILVSPETASLLPRRAVGAECGPGVLLARSPSIRRFAPDEEPHSPGDEAVLKCLSTEVRGHVLAAPAAPEHRNATVAFVQFGGLDELIEARGAAVAADALQKLVEAAQEGADLFQVCFLGSDVTAAGGKLILTAGAPRAVGDDEERMLLTLRHILEQPRELPVRIGVNRGRVFAGEIGPPFRRTYSVMGDAVNLAARLMAKAPWNAVYATEGVLVRSQTKFETTGLEPFLVKGKREPVQAWELGPLARPAAASGRKRAPLVGREEEYASLHQAVIGAEYGRGALIEIIGETGSGKSRLLTETRELAGRLGFAHTVCENYRRTLPYVVWRDILRQLLGLSWDDPDEAVVAALRAEVEASGADLLPWLPLLGIVFDASAPMTREVSELAPEYRQARLHEVVLEFLEPWLKMPTLVQIEHAHFMDEASAALLDALSRRIESAAWVITVTRRDVVGGFAGAPESSTQLVLGPLPHEAMLALAESAPEASLVPPHVLDTAVERAAGSPEFLLDLLATAAGGSEELPDSMEAAATARIDELDPADRILVRRASVLGLAFHPQLLRHVLEPGVAEPDQQTWSRMSSVFAADGDGYMRFKRPALCEAAYEGLPYRLRRQLHAAVAEALEPRLGRAADAEPAVLSLHFILAGDHDRAWRYARMAAERAVAKFAQADAARLYRRAIEAGRQNGASDLELAACWEAMGDALMQSGDSAAAVEALTAARKLAPGDRLIQGRLFLRHVRIAHRQGGLSAAVRWGGRGLRVLGETPDGESQALRAELLAELAYVRYMQRRLSEAERLCRSAIRLVEADGEQRPLAHAIHVLDLVLVDLGRLDEAVHSSRALAIYERLGEREEQGNVLNTLAMLAEVRWQWEEALHLYARAGEAYERSGTQGGIAVVACNTGDILLARGQLEEAARYLRRARRIWSANGIRGLAAYAAAALGRIAAREGRIDEARELVTEAAIELRALGQPRDLEQTEIIMAETEAFTGDASSALVMTDSLLSASSRERPWLRRIRGVSLARLGHHDAAVEELFDSLALARERAALYDVVATLGVLESLQPLPEPLIVERESLLARLGVEWVPSPTPLGSLI